MKGFVSLLLVLSLMAGLFVPVDISVFAEEEPATGSNIHCFVYKALDDNGNVMTFKNSGKTYERTELIFQKGDTPPYPDREYVMHVTDFDNGEKTNAALGIGGKEAYKQPWYDYNYTTYRLIIKDKIKPRKMTGWFMYMKNLPDENVQGLEDKIDTSICTSFNCTFNYCYLKNLDLTQWDVNSITDAGGMFSHQDGVGLKTLNISNWVIKDIFILCRIIKRENILAAVGVFGDGSIICGAVIAVLVTLYGCIEADFIFTLSVFILLLRLFFQLCFSAGILWALRRKIF